MYDVHVERSAGYSGIAFIVLVIVGVFLPGVPPPPYAPAAAVAAYLDAHNAMWMLSGWLLFPETAFFLWFVVQLRAYLRLVPQVDDGLGTYLLVGGVVGGMLALLTGIDQLVLGFRPSAELGEPAIRILYDVFNACGAMIFVPTAIMTVAASQSGRRHGSLPAGLVAWGYLAALGAAISTLSVFFRTGFFVMGGLGTLLFGLLPFTVWIIWSSLVLIRAPREGQKTA
jgi:hypothetical protein